MAPAPAPVRAVRRLGGLGFRAMAELAHKRFDRRFEADVRGHDYLGDEGVATGGKVFYEAAAPLPTEVALKRLRMGPGDVFVDLGCGKGRALLLAAEHEVDRVMGVELGEHLAETARRNLEVNRRRLRAREVEVHTGDVLDWEIPADLSVVFMYCPFFGEVFHATIAPLLHSYDAHPRPLRLVYDYPWEHDFLMSTGRFRPLDVIPGDMRLQPKWWRRGAVIVTYQVLGADGSAPVLPARRPLSRRALRHWSGPNGTRFELRRPGMETLYSDAG